MSTSGDATPPPESLYPVIESFVEVASPQEMATLFEPLKASLAELKGPRKEHAKKVQAAIERTEELLGYLLEVRERLEQEQKQSGKRR